MICSVMHATNLYYLKDENNNLETGIWVFCRCDSKIFTKQM